MELLPGPPASLPVQLYRQKGMIFQEQPPSGSKPLGGLGNDF